MFQAVSVECPQPMAAEKESPIERRIRENIRVTLDVRQHPQTELAKATKHANSWASMFLTGERGLRLKHLEPVAKLLGLPICALFLEHDHLLRVLAGDDIVISNAPKSESLPLKWNAEPKKARDLPSHTERQFSRNDTTAADSLEAALAGRHARQFFDDVRALLAPLPEKQRNDLLRQFLGYLGQDRPNHDGRSGPSGQHRRDRRSPLPKHRRR
jgi:hypothetical protein